MAKFFTTKKSMVTLAEVNVVPLIDTVFTLLIIFMVMAPVLHKGVRVQVPDSAVGESAPDQTQHVVSVTKEGQIWFDDQQATLALLAGFLQNLDPTETIYVQADQAIAYGLIMDVISTIKESGLQNVGLVTNPRPSKTASN